MLWLSHITTFLLSFYINNGDVFSSTSDLVQVLGLEKNLIDLFNRYINYKENSLSEEFYELVDEPYEINPINTFALLRRVLTNCRRIKKSFKHHYHYLNDLSVIKEKKHFPSDDDLEGAATAVLRLQETYDLNTEFLAQGKFNGVKFTASDCFELGRQAYDNKQFYYSNLWMEQAKINLNLEYSNSVKRISILEYMVAASYELGHTKHALEINYEILNIDPLHSNACKNKIMLRKMLDSNDERNQTKQIENFDFEEYKNLCRNGENNFDGTLKCRYFHGNDNPFLIIAPFKMEEIHLILPMYRFHNVISEKEIEILKRLAASQLIRAEVANRDKHFASDSRVAKLTWLKEHQHKCVRDITQRTADMTGLTMETSELLQVLNYGIGGYYNTHFDFEEPTTISHEDIDGNRIATVIYYLSDVERGGSTVFPRINVSVAPKKGTAVFWYNLHTNCKPHKLSLHAACPVLIGSKWTATKWIRERGQEFLRKCDLEILSEEFF